VTTFYLIRHAQRAGDQEVLAGRVGGLHLTATGREQALRVAHHLAREPIEHVFSSPLERTRETAEPLARARGLEVDVLPGIGEIDTGAWTGRRFPELDADDLQWQQFNRQRTLTPIPRGETALEVQTRFVGEMLRLRETFPDDGIALVSHADPIKYAIVCLLGAPLDFHDRLEIGLGSISVVTLDAGGPKVKRVNEIP
jgi:broad specificity phosphatase PhoE